MILNNNVLEASIEIVEWARANVWLHVLEAFDLFLSFSKNIIFNRLTFIELLMYVSASNFVV